MYVSKKSATPDSSYYIFFLSNGQMKYHEQDVGRKIGFWPSAFEETRNPCPHDDNSSRQPIALNVKNIAKVAYTLSKGAVQCIINFTCLSKSKFQMHNQTAPIHIYLMTGQNKNRLPSKRRSLESENNYMDQLLRAKSTLPKMATNSYTEQHQPVWNQSLV